MKIYIPGPIFFPKWSNLLDKTLFFILKNIPMFLRHLKFNTKYIHIYIIGLNVKILMKSTHFPQAEVLSWQKELELRLFYSQCQWFIVHPLKSILWYNCHTQVITELPSEGKEKRWFCQWLKNKMENTYSWVGMSFYLQNKMSFQWEDLCQVWKLSYSSVTNAPREKHNSHL